MSLATQAKGTLLQVETAEGSGVYVTIPEIGDITGPDVDAAEEDVTSQDTSGNDSETLVTLNQPRQVSFPLSYIPGNALHKQLRADGDNKTQRNYKLVEPSLEYTLFRAQVKAFGRMAPVRGVRKRHVTLRLNGPPTYSD
jgi:hypothetical protein